MPNSFTIHPLRFTAQVETTIEMDAFKGSALRGAGVAPQRAGQQGGRGDSVLTRIGLSQGAEGGMDRL